MVSGQESPASPPSQQWREQMQAGTHLQDEDEVVSRLVPGVQIVADIVFVVLIKLEFLNDVWVLEQPKQDLL